MQQPSMYGRYPSSGYPNPYYEPRAYAPEPRMYDPTQTQNPYTVGQPPMQPSYMPSMGYQKESEPSRPEATSYGKGFSNPLYPSFYTETPYSGIAFHILTIGIASAETGSSEQLTGGSGKKELKEEAYPANAFTSQPLDFNMYSLPKTENGDSNDTKCIIPI